MPRGLAGRYGCKAARFVLRQVPTGFYRRVIPRDAIGFVYHTVAPAPLPHVKHLFHFKTPEAFEEDIKFFRRHYTVLSLDDLQRHGKTNGHPALFLTFDDGMAECFQVVRPILLRHGLPCTFFVTTGFVDNKEMFYRHKVSLCMEAVQCAPVSLQTEALRLARVSALPAFRAWMMSLTLLEEVIIDAVCTLLEVDPQAYLRHRRPYLSSGEIRQLIADGFTIGAHTMRHPELSKLHDEPSVEAEIVDSCRVIQEMTKANRVPFAFPYSADGLDRSFLRELIQKHDVIGPLFDTHGITEELPFMRARIWGDVPRHAGSLIRQAYVEESQRRLRIANN